MGKPSQRGLTLNAQVYERLEKFYEKDRKKVASQSFTRYIQNILLEHIKYNEELAEYGGFLEYIHAEGNTVYVKDNRTGTIATVQIHTSPDVLYCDTHNTTDCAHISFCYAIKEVYMALIERGFRPPKKS